MIKKILIIAGIAYSLTIIFNTANAYYGSSNLSYGGYPDFNEMEPTQPYDHDEYSVDTYQSEVEEYVNKAKEYIQNGDNDINDIRDKQQEAQRKANQVVDEYNSWVNSGY